MTSGFHHSGTALAKKKIGGKDLQRTVLDYAKMRGWKCAHFPSVETKQGWRTAVAAEAKGWPDIFAVRDRAVAIEIKGTGDRMKPEQEEWEVRLRRACIEYYVVTPEDWENGNVEEILQ